MQNTRSNTINYVLLTVFALISVLPITVLFMNSLKPSTEIGANPLGFPQQIRLENFREAWIQGNYSTTMINSVILTFGTIAGTLLISGLAAYSLARLKPRGSGFIAFYVLIGASIPPQMFILPLFFMWRDAQLLNTHIGLIIIYCALNSPFATYLLRSYMVSLPEEFAEAARMDGATNVQIFYYVILPLTRFGFLTTGLVVGLAVWNEFLFAITFLPQPQMRPIATSLFAFQSQFSRDWALTSAASVLMLLPVMILFLLLQRSFIEGLSQGGLKG